MNRRSLMARMVPSLVLVAMPVLAQETQNQPGKPAPGASQTVLSQWNEIGNKLIAMAEDFPEDKYDFKPTKEQRSFAEQLLHMAGSNYLFTNVAQGMKPPAEEDPPRANYKTKTDVAAFVKKSFADGAAAIKAKGDKGMDDWVTDPDSGQKIRVADLAYGLIEHAGEHYGQLVVYYRVSGMVPPASRPKK